LKNRKQQKTKNFQILRTRITLCVAGIAAVSAAVIYLVYQIFLRGHIANTIVRLLRAILRTDYNQALNLYNLAFRTNREWIFPVALILCLLVFHLVYLHLFSKYLNELNAGIDALNDEQTQEIVLSPELEDSEGKLNAVRQTIAQRKLEAQVAQQRRNDLIIYLAHDLKTPLASVIGYLNLLHDEAQISDELREKYLSVSLSKAERLEDLINEFFEISRYNLTKISLQYSRVSLRRLLEMLLYEFQPMLQEKDLTSELHMHEDVILKCDPDKLQRVFDNLMRNAVLYSYEGTEISVSVEEQEGKVRLRFENQGDTIPADKLERIFEQFYRLDAARSTSTGGAGLGLAIAKEIVELHHGKLTAESENERTVFEVVLPES